VDVQELRPGLWRWTAPHARRPGATVACVAVVSRSVVLIDPQAPPADSTDGARFWAALDRDVERCGAPAILLTGASHVRSTAAVLARYAGAELWVPAPAASFLPGSITPVRAFAVGDALPAGIVAVGAGGDRGDVVYFLPLQRALVAGDVLVGDAGAGLRLAPGRAGGDDAVERVRAVLGPVLALPVELVLPSHGEAVSVGARDALECALRP
jgi:glyoxylase-like metal-dependent hydrolase (beta-lactamase superfamily II)